MLDALVSPLWFAVRDCHVPGAQAAPPCGRCRAATAPSRISSARSSSGCADGQRRAQGHHVAAAELEAQARIETAIQQPLRRCTPPAPRHARRSRRRDRGPCRAPRRSLPWRRAMTPSRSNACRPSSRLRQAGPPPRSRRAWRARPRSRPSSSRACSARAPGRRRHRARRLTISAAMGMIAAAEPLAEHQDVRRRSPPARRRTWCRCGRGSSGSRRRSAARRGGRSSREPWARTRAAAARPWSSAWARRSPQRRRPALRGHSRCSRPGARGRWPSAPKNRRASPGGGTCSAPGSSGPTSLPEQRLAADRDAASRFAPWKASHIETVLCRPVA